MKALHALAIVGLALLLAGAARAEPSVTIAAVGDVQLGGRVGKAMAARGFDYPFARLNAPLRQADLAVRNLECALSRDGKRIAKRYTFQADPRAAAGLARAGFDIAGLANNHGVDCGRDHLAESLAALRQQHLLPVGAGATAEEAEAPVIVVRRGLRIAILARTFIPPDKVTPKRDAPTVAMYDPTRLLAQVRAARRQADIVIVSLHWGVEYMRHPQDSQRHLAHALIDAGATLLLGHHTHSPQSVERYRHGLIAYSLGNFVFDSSPDRSRHGLLLTCTLTRAGVTQWRVTPTHIVRGQAREG